MPTINFKEIWVTEAVRQREEHWGPIEDNAVVLQLRAQPISLADKVIQRALLLSRRDGLLETVNQWISASKFALILFIFLAILSGIGMAYSALSTSHINVIMALVALLGLHAITFIFWLFTLFATWDTQTLLGRVWLWLSKKLARSPDATLAMQSFIHTSNQQGSLRWILSSISHGFWLISLTSCLITMLLLLSTKSYTFGWETTILSSNGFVGFTQIIGFIPSLLGFPIPDVQIIHASGNHIASQIDAQKAWSIWLLGQLVVWGILTRLISFIFSFIKARLTIKRTTIDITLPSYSTLIKRLEQRAEKIDIDASAPNYELPNIDKTTPTNWTTERLIVGLEIPSKQVWPPFILHPSVTDVGKIESREQRHQLMLKLINHPVKELLLVCDGRQTPDRGIAYFIKDVAGYAERTSIYLIEQNDDHERMALWQQTLTAIGLNINNIFNKPSQISHWISE
ncbi:hypothetical protein V757_07135 [Pelistega indica]|uniref:DUF2868 domain-containing protein n=1 Tax=Pelistega indica TaxID=1414851 RepID=V8G2S9_9BURK|nr:DUF2868 domain-containing protein [Pelistega indica]ETD70745.1 hypothetical protein V757_07135 [Pelistega indica]